MFYILPMKMLAFVGTKPIEIIVKFQTIQTMCELPLAAKVWLIKFSLSTLVDCFNKTPLSVTKLSVAILTATSL